MPRMDQLSNYATTICGLAGGLTIITYHNTAIVQFDATRVKLQTGGWDSVTTRRKMNQASAQFGLGYSVYRDKGVSYVRWPDGSVEPLGRENSFARSN